jgi:hypothetical protein
MSKWHIRYFAKLRWIQKSGSKWKLKTLMYISINDLLYGLRFVTECKDIKITSLIIYTYFHKIGENDG